MHHLTLKLYKLYVKFKLDKLKLLYKNIKLKKLALLEYSRSFNNNEWQLVKIKK